MTRYARKFRRIAASLGPVELTAEPFDEHAFELSDIDLLENRDQDRRFLDFYGRNGLELAFERYGLRAALLRRGYRDLRMESRAEDNRHLLFVWATHEASKREHRVVELAVRRDNLSAEAEDGLPAIEPIYDALTLDWLQLCDPERKFTDERPQLPGQTYPGLGVGERVLEMLFRVAARLDQQVVVTVGEFFHNGYLYSSELPLFEPSAAGRLAALAHDLLENQQLTLAQASWAVHWNLVSLNGTPYRWSGTAQMRPRVPSLWTYFESRAYAEHQRQAREDATFSLDRAQFDTLWAERYRAGRVDSPDDPT